MKKRFIIIYSIFASLVILFALSYFGFNLYREYKQADSRTSSVFANTVYNFYTDLEKSKGSSDLLAEEIVKSNNSLKDYSYFEIEKNGNVIFSYPMNVPEENTVSNFTKYFSTIIEVNDDKYQLTCNIYLLKPYSIYNYSRIAFFIILGLTVLTLVLIIIENYKNKNIKIKETINDLNENSQFDKNEDNFDTDECSGKIEIIDNEVFKSPNEIIGIPNEEEILEDDSDEEIIDDLLEVENEEELENENFKENEPIENIEELDEIQNDEKNIDKNNDQGTNEPEGLFSNITGLGWESYLITRLENEINRAVSSEMDLSLLLIKIKNIQRDNAIFKDICKYLGEQFQFKDLLFEYKDDSIAGIKTGDNLEEALTFSENLINDINKLLNGTDGKCFMGITTRSVRMISAERFINEAEQALLHAEEDPNTPIIAFKADLDKYKKYMEQQPSYN